MPSGPSAGVESEGVAHLEADRLTFRGDPRLVIAFNQVSSTRAEDGCLEITAPGLVAVLCGLGPKAARWARAISQPRSVIEKLGIQPGMGVALIDLDDRDFERSVEARGAVRVATGCDAVFIQVRERADLARLAGLRETLKPDGALWVLRPKGSGEVSEMDVLNAGRSLGLVDTKVVAFSAALSAAKFVIPLADRPPLDRPSARRARPA